MAKKNKAHARYLRSFFIEYLGGVCARCGEVDIEKLVFDLKIPMGDKHHRMDTSTRMSFYRKQMREKNNVQLLCEGCNNRKADAQDQEYYHEVIVDENNNPF